MEALTALQAIASCTSLLKIAYDAYKKCNPTNHIEQLQDCLINAWQDTAKQQKYQNISSSVPETFSSLNKNSGTIKVLQEIVEKELNKFPIEVINCFISNFHAQLCKDKNSELYKNFELQFHLASIQAQSEILQILKNTSPMVFNPEYNLTPKTPCWENKYLQGIDDFVKELCKKLQNNRPRICLTGMGGIGKTETLNKIYTHFANKPNASFAHIALVTYKGSMDSDLMQQIDYPGDKTVDAVWSYMQKLCADKSVLLLIDDDRLRQTEQKQTLAIDETFSKLFTLNATVLFASRTSPEKFTNEPIKPLSEEACVQIFKANRYDTKNYRLPDVDEKVLLDIVKNRAGRNPLALTRLGTMTKAHNWTIAELTQKLEAKKFDIRKGLNDETLQEEFNKLYPLKDIKNCLERKVLEMFALFPSLPLEQKTCVQWLCEDANIDEDDCRLALNNLSKLTWLMFHEHKQEEKSTLSGSFYAMHQLVKVAVLSQTTSILFDNHRRLVEQLASDVSWDSNEIFKKAELYVPFAESLADYFFEKQTQTETLATLMLWLGRYYDDTADYTKALQWNFKALTIKEKVLDKEHPSTATTYHNIAEVYRKQGDYAKALEWFEKALAIDEKVFGKEHPSTAITYNNISGVYDSLGDFEVALEWNFKALTIKEKVLDKEHPSTATTYHNIAGVYREQGDFEVALEWFEKALAIYEKVLGKEHPSTATTYDNIAGVYREQGEYERALEWCMKALAIREKVLGKEHPDTACTYNNIASVYDSLGDYAKALVWYLKSYCIVKRLGEAHPNTVVVRNNMEAAYASTGGGELFEDWLKKKLGLRKDGE
ncbi:MAG: tetratricopeptide repeat protein [Candidatus Bathyarchaeota archaeon]|nr:tetratricopeptide repeat protein [Candidatus Termiticorpusculum sp.]